MDYQLTAITEISELQQLRDLYLRDWPTHCVGYYCIDNFVRWLQRAPEIENLHFYTLNGDWRSEGLVLIVDRYQMFLNSLNNTNDTSNGNGGNGDTNKSKLEKALSLLDWSRGYKVSSFLERHRAAVLSVVAQKQLQLEYDSLTVMYYMPCALAKQLEVSCPTGYQLKPLTLADASTVDALWPNRHKGSLFLIRRLIAWNPSMGVYTAETHELVAWCLRLQGGFLGALQVRDAYKRLGLGSVVARATSRRIAELGHDVMALVNKDNTPSCRMFDKLGFEVVDTCYWLRSHPTTGESFEWPVDA